MAIQTFSDLKTAIASWSDRTDIGDSTLTDFVTLADARIRKDLSRHEIRMREMETTSDLSVSSGVATLPTDFMAMQSVQTRASNPTRLEYKPVAWLNEAYPDGDSGTPAYYTIKNGNLEMYPLTSSDIRIEYWAYPAALSDSNTSNWLLLKYPDIYLHAGLLELRIYEENEDRMQFETGLLSAAFDGLDKAGFGSQMAVSPAIGASARAT